MCDHDRGATFQKPLEPADHVLLSPVVILDEPTSHLDSLSEQHVVRGLKRLLEGRTAIVIAHRLSTVRNSDLVAVLEAGRLVEFGPPEHLLMSDGIYRQLSALQAGPLVPIAQSPEAEAHPAR